MGLQDLQVQPRMLQISSAHCCLIGYNSLCVALENHAHNKVLQFDLHSCKPNVTTQAHVQLQKTAWNLCILFKLPCPS